MNITVKGIIKRIEETQVVSDKFQKRTAVITVPDGEYSQDVGIEFTQDKVGKLDQYKEGEKVSVECNLKGRDWTNPKDGIVRNFVSLQGWKIDYADEHAEAIEGAELQKRIHSDNDPQDDLPF